MKNVACLFPYVLLKYTTAFLLCRAAAVLMQHSIRSAPTILLCNTTANVFCFSDAVTKR